ncbi:MAG: type II secretion system F family protein [Victivallales bacterium]|nr:type II secretion system F family protein [Victivallales bacterium]
MHTVAAFTAAVSAGIAVCCAILFVAGMLRRLEVERHLSRESRRLPLFLRMFLPLAPNVIRLIRGPAFDQWRYRTSKRLLMAGYDLSITPDGFISIRILSGMVGAVFLMYTVCVGQSLIGFICFVLLLAYPGVWLWRRIQQRHLEILKALPNLLDLLTLSVEAGKDFLSALRDIVRRRKKDALGEEFDRVLKEIQLGKPRSQALKEMAQRVQLPDLSTVVNAIVQAEELGVSIADLLRIQGDLLRGKRFTRAEAMANKAPVKILFPLVIFIFPAIFIIILVPMLMNVMRILGGR